MIINIEVKMYIMCRNLFKTNVIDILVSFYSIFAKNLRTPMSAAALKASILLQLNGNHN